MGFAEDFIWLH